jgi:putative acetyltransferase
MEKEVVFIEPYKEQYREQIIKIWEKSVHATHKFLSPEDYEFFKKIVSGIDFSEFTMFCSTNKKKEITGFIGIAGKKVEMLFLHPEYMGRGIGKSLMKKAFTELKISEVDVNEQNINAVNFYKKLGFEVYARTPNDGEGKPYPILKMKIGNWDNKPEAKSS